MAALDHVILKVNDLGDSIAFYTDVMGFALEGTDGPFTLVRAGPDFQLQLAPWGTQGFEHYAFVVSRAEFEQIFARIRTAAIAYGPTFDSVGSNTGPRFGVGRARLCANAVFQRSEPASAGDPVVRGVTVAIASRP